jgi:hypothetical protein
VPHCQEATLLVAIPLVNTSSLAELNTSWPTFFGYACVANTAGQSPGFPSTVIVGVCANAVPVAMQVAMASRMFFKGNFFFIIVFWFLGFLFIYFFMVLFFSLVTGICAGNMFSNMT